MSNTEAPAIQPERTWTHTVLEPEPVAATPPSVPAQPQYVYPPARPRSGMAITNAALRHTANAIWLAIAAAAVATFWFLLVFTPVGFPVAVATVCVAAGWMLWELVLIIVQSARHDAAAERGHDSTDSNHNTR